MAPFGGRAGDESRQLALGSPGLLGDRDDLGREARHQPARVASARKRPGRALRRFPPPHREEEERRGAGDARDGGGEHARGPLRGS
jgi:hypothetical protein